MTIADRDRWDAKYADRDVPLRVEPPEWLVRHASALPPGEALDVACGLGHAPIWLAQRGWNVTALDISEIGLKVARRFADQNGVQVNFQQADLDNFDLDYDQYDLITVFRFLDRSRLPQQISQALRPGGMLLYETFLASDGCPNDGRPTNPAFVLLPGELPTLLSRITVVEFTETPLQQATARFAGVKL